MPSHRDIVVDSRIPVRQSTETRGVLLSLKGMIRGGNDFSSLAAVVVCYFYKLLATSRGINVARTGARAARAVGEDCCESTLA